MQQPPNQEYPLTDVLDNIPFAERRVIHALVVFWQYTRYSDLNQVRPSPRILELIDRCRIGINFFRQVYRDLCSDRRIKYVGFSESEFKQFLVIEYNQPFVEHQAQARANQEQARADFDALGEEMAKTTDRKERIELGRRREVLAPFTGRTFVYQNHCWQYMPSAQIARTTSVVLVVTAFADTKDTLDTMAKKMTLSFPTILMTFHNSTVWHI
jgi:hypothetical protein